MSNSGYAAATRDPYGSTTAFDDKSDPSGSKWAPRNWSKTTIAAVIAAVVIIIAAVVVGAVLGTRASSTDYSTLSYTLQDTYSGTDFFDQFDYYTATDPSDGFVTYVSAATAASDNLTYASSTRAILRVDTSDTTSSTTSSSSTTAGSGFNSGNTRRQSSSSSTGRNSVRITSKKQYNSGLFIFDVLNSPYGCGTWPALWLTDPNNWPAHGEIDVMEAVNQATTGNQMTLHTTDDCKMNVKRKETGTVLETNCWNETDDNAGCGVKGPDDTFGEVFNTNGGGVYALEWRDAGIRIWFFARGDIPSNIPTDLTNTTAPDPNVWGEPLADFPSTHCDIATHFKNQSIIANIDLCGDWAGATSVYSTEDGCPDTCEEYVQNNGTAFDTAYWEWSSWRVYTAS